MNTPYFCDCERLGQGLLEAKRKAIPCTQMFGYLFSTDLQI
jgi:hypothetical protein